MSLLSLSSELDELIIKHLHQGDINALSRTSRAYRAVAEPHLYTNLEFFANQESRVRWLVTTLLCRPELAAHIRTVKFDGLQSTESHTASKASPEPRNSSAEHLELAMPRLQQVTVDFYGPERIMMKHRKSLMDAVLGKEHLEGSLALVCCLASDVESIKFTSREGLEFLNFLSRISDVRKARGRPSLANLKTLQIRASSTSSRVACFDIAQALENAYFHSSRIVLIASCRLDTMQALELVDFDLDPAGICRIVQEMPRLQRLVLRRLFHHHIDHWQIVVTSLASHCPQLREFEFGFKDINPVAPYFIPRLTGLSQLLSLQTLRIDRNQLIWVTWSGLTTQNDILPASLESLHLTMVNTDDFIRFFTRYFTPQRLIAMRNIAPILSVSELTFEVNLSTQTQQTLAAVHAVIVLLHAQQIDCKIYDVAAASTGLPDTVRISKDGVLPW